MIKPITRRHFLFSMIATALCLPAAIESLIDNRPNIVFILADDLGCGTLKSYNPKSPINTPNIDKLSSTGIRFTQAYSPAPVCTPTRNCFMTNRNMGNQDNIFWPYLTPDDTTIANVLSGAGYTCGCFGKWGLGVDVPPNRAGFDEFIGTMRDWHKDVSGSSDGDVWPDELWHNGELINVSGQYGPDVYLQYALDFIDNANKPFFCYFPSNLAHQASQEYPTPGINLYQNTDWPQVEKNYANAITYLDGQIGSIINKLSQKGILDNTIIVFSSDNGQSSLRTTFWGNYGLRGNKGDVYEGGIRVPLIISGLDVAPGIVNTPTILYDLFPTFGDIASATYHPGDGISLLPALYGYNQPIHNSLYWCYYAGFPFVEPVTREAIRINNIKLVRITDKCGGQTIELFDLASDPGETINLTTQNQQTVDYLLSKMTYINQSGHCLYTPLIIT